MKRPSAAIQRFETKKQTGIINIDKAIIGMPKLWVRRFMGCSWLCAYSSIQSSQDLPPIILLIPRLCELFYTEKPRSVTFSASFVSLDDQAAVEFFGVS